MTKNILYLNRRAPHGTQYAQEGLEVALIGAAFDQIVTVAYIDDGVFQLRRNQDTSETGTKNWTAALQVLGEYEIKKIYVERESLAERGMTQSDLVALTYEDEEDAYAEKPLIQVVGSEEVAVLIADADVLLNFQPNII